MFALLLLCAIITALIFHVGNVSLYNECSTFASYRSQTSKRRKSSWVIMSNFHSRHLYRAIREICACETESNPHGLEFQVRSNRLDFHDRQYVEEELPALLHLIEINLGAFYEQAASSVYPHCAEPADWPKHKWNEMLDKDLVYIVIRLRQSRELIGFASVAHSETQDEDQDKAAARSCLFLYEIHFIPEWQSHGLGTHVLYSILVPAARDIACRSIQLCVFPSNKAREWYLRQGFLDCVQYSSNLIGMSKAVSL